MATKDRKTEEPPKNPLLAAAANAFVTAFDGVLELAPEEEGHLWIDGRKAPPAISSTPPGKATAEQSADCVWHGRRQTLIRSLSGQRAVESAYLSGRIKISGDISVMARLDINENR